MRSTTSTTTLPTPDKLSIERTLQTFAPSFLRSKSGRYPSSFRRRRERCLLELQVEAARPLLSLIGVTESWHSSPHDPLPIRWRGLAPCTRSKRSLGAMRIFQSSQVLHIRQSPLTFGHAHPSQPPSWGGRAFRTSDQMSAVSTR